jgi:hypothetical protein
MDEETVYAEVVLVKTYPTTTVKGYRGTCLHCNKPIQVAQDFQAIILMDDREKNYMVIMPAMWINCPHCQEILPTLTCYNVQRLYDR